MYRERGAVHPSPKAAHVVIHVLWARGFSTGLEKLKIFAERIWFVLSRCTSVALFLLIRKHTQGKLYKWSRVSRGLETHLHQGSVRCVCSDLVYSTLSVLEKAAVGICMRCSVHIVWIHMRVCEFRQNWAWLYVHAFYFMLYCTSACQLLTRSSVSSLLSTDTTVSSQKGKTSLNQSPVGPCAYSDGWCGCASLCVCVHSQFLLIRWKTFHGVVDVDWKLSHSVFL